MYIKIYVNAVLYIAKVEIIKKLKRQLMKVRTGLLSDDRVCTVNHSELSTVFWRKSGNMELRACVIQLYVIGSFE
jgi:hypothetical protein